VKAHCAFPSATHNEINEKDAQALLKNGVYVVAEGANMPSNLDGVKQFVEPDPLRAGQGRERGRRRHLGPRDGAEQHALLVDARGGGQPSAPHHEEHPHSLRRDRGRFGTPGNYVNGANIAGFLKVAGRDDGPRASCDSRGGREGKGSDPYITITPLPVRPSHTDLERALEAHVADDAVLRARGRRLEPIPGDEVALPDREVADERRRQVLVEVRALRRRHVRSPEVRLDDRASPV
jgi:hypothetical protein